MSLSIHTEVEGRVFPLAVLNLSELGWFSVLFQVSDTQQKQPCSVFAVFVETQTLTYARLVFNQGLIT